MAGYVTKLAGHVYNGDHLAAEPLVNGVFACIAPDGVRQADSSDQQFRILERTTLWGMPALVLDVVTDTPQDVFFVENEWEVSPDAEWDEARHTLPVGKHVRMKRLLPGEQIITTFVDDAGATPGTYVSLQRGELKPL